MRKNLWKLGVAGVLAAALAGCGGQQQTQQSEGGSKLSGAIKADGSSTVFLISEAVAEEFRAKYPDVNVTVGSSGTGGGFKKFCVGETDLQDASRPIKDEEDKKAAAKGIKYIELPVAYDGLTVVVNPKNTWAKSLTVAELKKIWEPGSKITNWSQVRAGFPNKPLKLYGPDADSGTFEYFTEEIVGKKKQCRSDFTPSGDDNVLVQGVARTEGALAYFGLAYYEENKDKVKAVAIDAGKGPVLPSAETVRDHTYQPLSRPLFIYVSTKAAARPEVKEFVKFYLTEGKPLVEQVGYVPLPDELYPLALKRFEKGMTSSMFLSPGAAHAPLVELMGLGK